MSFPLHFSLVEGALYGWESPGLNYLDQTNVFPLALQFYKRSKDINILLICHYLWKLKTSCPLCLNDMPLR